MTRAGDRYRLDDRVAVITGGSSGLGVDLAITFADAGAKVVICGRRAPMLEQTRACRGCRRPVPGRRG
jgi:NAD(P)-dependent dehydrogenase (short-subunit alcohol dehydrogenase family)